MGVAAKFGMRYKLPEKKTSTVVWKSKFYGAFVLNHRVVLQAGAARMLVYKGGANNTTQPLLGWHANGHATMGLFHAVLLELCHAPCQRDDR